MTIPPSSAVNDRHITFMIKTLPTVSIKLCCPLCGKKQGMWCKSSSLISITKVTGKTIYTIYLET